MLRRSFLEVLGYGSFGLATLNARSQGTITQSKASVLPRGSAENLVIINLKGGPSHVDTFDLKTGSWTPADFEPATVGNINLAGALFPNLLERTDRFSLLRCITHNEAVHQRASYLLETCQTFNPTFSKEQPHIGSLMASELASLRTSNDILPAFMAINGLVQGPGLLSSTHAPFSFSAADGVGGLTHPGGQDLFQKRYESLLRFDQKNREDLAARGQAISDYHNFYDLGRKLMYEPELDGAFTVTDEELGRYGNSGVGAGCAIASKLLAKSLGLRVIQINHGGWDMHYDIYDRNIGGNIYELSNSLDQAVAILLDDLAAAPGKRGGTLLDETLVLVVGEFGRTPGNITNNLGRDHYPYTYSALMAGGGVIPGQTFGATDAEGWAITDPFWSENRYITVNDLIATLYSSLGIDWTQEISDTPSGRVFEYTPKVNGVAGYYKDIAQIFS